MIQVLLVDDEFMVRNHIKSLIDWDYYGMEIAGMASNGQMALKFLEKHPADIILLDIKMPVMDGIEFLKKIKETGNHAKVVILSSYEDFFYAQQAIRLGAVNYLLKHILNADSLVETLNEVKEIIAKEKMTRSQMLELKQKMDVMKRFSEKDDFFSQLIKGELDENAVYCKIKELGLNLGMRYYIPVVFSARKEYSSRGSLMAADWDIVKVRILDTIQQSIFVCARGEAFNSGGQDFCVLINDIGCRSMGEARNRIERLVHTILDTVLLDFKVKMVACTGPDFNNLSDFIEVYNKTVGLLDYFKFFAGASILHYDKVKYSCRELDSGKIECMLNNYKFALGGMNAKEAEDILKRLFLFEIREALDLKAFHHVVRELELTFLLQLKKYQNSLDIVFNMDEPEALNNIEKVYEWFLRLTLELITRVNRMDSSNNSIIMRVFDYVRGNYNKDISLESAAKDANISKIYLSQLFKKDTGENFIDYLTRFRVEKAKTILENSRLKMDEVSSLVGFGSPKYFSSVFKKLTDLTPQEYRALHKGTTDMQNNIV